MTTFAKGTFNAAIYASYRPTYPRQLFDSIFKYHESSSRNARWDTAVDLGCGTGQATTELTPFKKIIGVDPSAGMIEKAKSFTETLKLSNKFEYVQSAAEELEFIKEGSVDLIVTAQAAHWFDWSKLWPECGRILRKDGSIAVWGYSEIRFPKYPSLTPLIQAYSKGSDPRISLGPHWQQPGRDILDNHYLEVPSPNPEVFTDFKRMFYVGDHRSNLPGALPTILRKRMPWTGVLAYLRTYSSLHTFRERYPEDAKNPKGRLEERFWGDLKNRVAEEEGKEVLDEDQIEVEWPVALILARRI